MRAWLGPFITGFLALVAAAHITLTLAVPDLAEKFQLGDRAGDRIVKTDALLRAPNLDSVIAALVYHDAPGDYILFLPAYLVFGPAGVIAQNIILLLVGLSFLYRIGVTWFSPAVAKTACIVYVLLPATIFHPQVLVTEAICDPLLIVATWYAGQLVTQARPPIRDAVIFGLICAVLIFVREIFLLVPFLVTSLILARPGTMRRTLALSGAILVLSLSLTGIWRLVSWSAPERYERTTIIQSLPSNLFLRAERMAAIGSFALPEGVSQHRAMSMSQFAELAAQQPSALVHTVISDAVNLAGNTGVAMVYGRYLGLFNLGETEKSDVFKWRDIRDQYGTRAMLAYLAEKAPVALAFTISFTLAWVMLLAVTLFGAWRFLLGPWPLELRLLFAAIPVYIFTLSFAAGSLRWDHRSPMEFVICLFFALGAAELIFSLRKEKQSWSTYVAQANAVVQRSRV